MVTAEPPGTHRLTPKGRATRERILKAAGELLITEGLSGLNMAKVREAASVSGSQLTHYYLDKQALIRAVVSRQGELVLEFQRQPGLGTLDTFDDFERWINLNLRRLRRIGYVGTPTYHTLAGQLVKSDEATRTTVATGYWRWVELIEQAIRRMKDRRLLVADAEPRQLAMVLVAAHQGGATIAFAYRQEWPLADALRFAVNYMRTYATDPAEQVARRPRRPRDRRKLQVHNGSEDDTVRFTRKGLETRERIIERAADLMFERGVAATTMEDVRGTAWVSGSQLSHYFADKRDLTRQVIAARLDDVMRFHTQPQLAGLDSLAALRAWADACAAQVDTVYRRGGCIYGSLTGELLEADDGVLDDLAAGYDQWLELFLTGLAEMRRRGDLTTDADPRHLAVALVAAHQGGTMITFATGSSDPTRVALNAAVDYVASCRRAHKPRRARNSARPNNKT